MGSNLFNYLKNKNVSIRTWFIITILISFSIVIISYSILATHFLFQGMKEIISYDIKNITLNGSPSKILNISDYWYQQPNELKSLLPEGPNTKNQLYRIPIPRQNNTEKLSSWVVYKFQNDFKTKYISFINNPEIDLSNYRLMNPTRIVLLLISTSVFLLLFIALVLWYTFRTMDKPILALKNWANSLNIHNLNKPIPNFIYPELNGFARLLHNNVKAISQASEREHRFLSYTSHELRTPLSIVISNTDILKYLINQSTLENKEKLQQAIKRLERSTNHMKGIINAILWLDRGSESIILEPVKVHELINDIIQQHTNIISNNPKILLTVLLDPMTIKTYNFPLQIILTNLIRNAFQHTLHGKITIQLKQNYLTIENSLTESKYGFGIGLELTRRLAEKLGFEYSAQQTKNSFFSTLILNPHND